MSECFVRAAVGLMALTWMYVLLWASTALAITVTLTDMYGTISSPSFPESYPRDSEVQWDIRVSDGYRVRLYFMHFDVEPSYQCEYDYVKVYAGAELVAVFCGKENTDTERVPTDDIMSAGSVLSLNFHSDFSNEERYSGFQAHYSALDVDECEEKSDEDSTCDHFCHNYIGGYYCSCRYGYQLHSDNRTCKVECNDSVFTERSGLISSPDFPKPYPKSSDCEYRVELEPGLQVTLEFDEEFDIEDHPEVSCPYDHIKVQAGERELGPFCGDRSPGRIQTGSNMVRILFHTDNSGENLGWRLIYTSTGSECPALLSPPNGLLEPQQSQYFFKDHVTVTCDPGYSMEKDGEKFAHYQIDCLVNGTWSSTVPLCKMVDCGPVAVALGEVMYNSSGNSTTFGSKILFRCQSSAGEHSVYRCAECGVWVSEDGATPLTCQPDVQNTTPPVSQSPTQPACGEPSQSFPSHSKRIVGGTTASPGLFPWQVLLSVRDASRVPEGRWFGGGALLSPSWVLTAAHVLRSPRRDTTPSAPAVPVAPQHVRATLGLTHVRDRRLALERVVERVVLHPHFNPQSYDNDIALLKLGQEVVLSDIVRPVCLPAPPQTTMIGAEDEHPLANTLGVVAGWGIDSANITDDDTISDPGAASEVLQYVKLPVVEQDECRASYASRSARYNITHNMFCAGFYEGGRDTCLGDSGGAFVSRDPRRDSWVVQGLVSWGGPERCGSRRVYGVYTRVANYARWIQEEMGVEAWE